MKLLIFGYGFSAKAFAKAAPDDWEIIATTRSAEKAAQMQGVTPRIFPGDDLRQDVAEATHILISAGPQDGRDPVLAELRDAFAAAKPEWVGYLSTTGVYGDHQGGWVTEDTPLTPTSVRGEARVATEGEWLELYRDHGLPVHIFRLAGIYGPGRGPFAKVRSGNARRVVKENQVFSRTHIDDIAQVLLASIARPNPGAAYNVCDDQPAPPQDVIAHAAKLLGLPIPPEVAFEDAEMTPMGRSFYSESKRVDNTRIKEELGVKLLYPDYDTGLTALLSAEREG
ncbi:SDR family oxidoreductase [Rhodobacteraceae bacterium M385]|nr:SDR family oxidoreductase [Rhodobacteraceae bacterium M385]